ncbi:MAG: flagellar motor protein MotB, partial [Pseudomonadota bacterium]
MSEEKQEIIIVRRGGDDHDGHHGGAWKIAFADFMTAMMALFLVLWLVNAANEETKKAVASYFNPVKLVDRNKSTRGLSDPGGSSQPDNSGENLPTDPSDPTDDSAGAGAVTGPTQAFTDTEFFAYPMTVLEILASQGLAEAALEEALAEQLVGEALTDAETAIEFVDPFAPDNWTALDNRETAVFDAPGDRQSEAVLVDEPQATAEAQVPQTIDRI